MRRVVALRVGGGLLTLLLTSVLVFASTEVLPGDAAQVHLGRSATPDRLERLRAEMGLDRPAAERYGDWLAGVAQGDFGNSWSRASRSTSRAPARRAGSRWRS